jgi:hypothetical protein
MCHFELRDFIFGPCPESAGRAHFHIAYAKRRMAARWNSSRVPVSPRRPSPSPRFPGCWLHETEPCRKAVTMHIAARVGHARRAVAIIGNRRQVRAARVLARYRAGFE